MAAKPEDLGQPEPLPFWTVADTARFLGITGEAVRKAANRGRLPVALRLSRGQRLFDPSAVKSSARELSAADVVLQVEAFRTYAARTALPPAEAFERWATSKDLGPADRKAVMRAFSRKGVQRG